jgi:DNA-directed RNA polymerase subunit RPC12/RpoP
VTIEFSCEVCGKTLSTSDDKAGRKAKCPGCGEMLIVPRPDGESVDAGGDEDDLPPLPSRKSSSGKVACPMCGEKISASATTCEFCGEELEGTSQKGGHAIIETGNVISSGWNCFKEQMGITIGLVIVGGIISGIARVPGGVLDGIAGVMEQQGERDTAIMLRLLGLLFLPVVIGVQLYISCGQTIGLLKIARGEPVEIGVLFQGGKYFWRSLGSSIVFGLMVFAGFLLCIIPGFIVSLMFSPFMYVLVDEDPPGIDCLWRAKAVTNGNKLSLFVIGIACFGINILGFLAACVGLIFTIPLTTLIVAVAYCKMTGQRTAG